MTSGAAPTVGPMTQHATSPTRYRFPSSLPARLAHAAGLGSRVSARQTATGEKVGERTYRFWHTKADRSVMPPSLALVSEPEVQGPANEALVVPLFSRAWDGRECVSVQTQSGTDLYGTGEIAGPLRRNGKTSVAYCADKPGYTDKTPALYQAHPWVLAVRADGTAFGVLADTTWHTDIDLTDGISMSSRGPAFHVYVIEGDSPQEVVKGLARLTGTIDMPPRWALGYHQCRFSYEPDWQVLEIARGFRQRQIPCDVLWMDIDYMDRFRIFTFDPEKFPHPEKLNADLHEIGFKNVWMIDPGAAVENDYFVWEQGTERDVWCKTWDGHDFRGPVWPPDCSWPDFTRADVCDWWGGLYKDFMATGIDGVWNDMNEPAIVMHGKEGDFTMDPDARHSGGLMGLPPGPHAQYHNVFGYLMVRASREGIMKANPEKRPFVLTRANFIGGHRYAATWTGDNTSTWDDVRWSISMCLNMGLSGQPFVGPDLGGFMGEGSPDMMAKWWGFGTLLPFCRGHTTKNNIEKEPWSFGPEAEATITRALRRRYRLLPYLYTLFREAHDTGMPVIRPVFFADPKNAALRGEEQSFLLGADVLVLANTLERGDPAHTEPGGLWRSFEPVEGPHDPALAVLKIRGGAIVPLGPVMEWTDQKPVDPLTLVVCLDEEGKAEGALYEDAGEGFGHTRGEYCMARFAARVDGDSVEITMSTVGGQSAPTDREIQVEVVGEHGVIRGSGRTGQPIRVHTG